MTQPKRKKVGKSRQKTDNLPVITFEGLEPLETMITNGELNLLEHYFQELLEDIGKGNT